MSIIITESSLDDMARSIKIGFPNTTKREHIVNSVNITGLNLVPYVGMRVLLAVGTASSNGNTYKPVIQFLKVNYMNESTDDNVTFKATGNQEFNIEPINSELTQIKVRCNCLDYYYRFAFYNNNQGDHYPPKAKPYIRKTTTYPPANPQKVPGVCKHILKLADFLEKTQIIA